MRWGRRIIATLLVLVLPWLGGCSAVRLTYGQGPLLAYWWLDGYMDFSSEQSPRVKAALEDFMAWHRATQLPDYAALLARLQPIARQPVSASQVCSLNEDIQRRIETAYKRAVPAMAEIVRGLSPEQLNHLEKRYARNLEEATQEFLQPVPAERQAASLKRTLERAESLYGPLDEAQRALLAAGLQASPFDARRWLDERRARQQDILDGLRQLLASRADAAAVQAALRAFAAHNTQSPRPEYRAYQRRLVEANCALTARLHNSLRPEQRQHAADKLKGWEEDARALMRPEP